MPVNANMINHFTFVQIIDCSFCHINIILCVGCSEPFCIVEMDEPPQKNSTSIKKDTSNPVWDEHFLL